MTIAELLLTPRQCQVLALRADGKTRKEIASEMGLSLKAVEYHFHGNQDDPGIYQRLGIYDVALLTQWALQQGLVKPHTFPSNQLQNRTNCQT